ncbi:Arf-GAP with coiled-coil, ANK repeat and PH domain-containing protein 2 [Melipona quadrifasciata]|uniref:Arf-GAP with coiled-coil, ANK repeat and PH domain-containing protein 2 n=1 Tax=Melipona quadrifasciata TaxID=166423 RepID=A0A0N1IT12_9HYME|nr:Arf-GAP with coiled-coil, ANK repeat and PH domain-containing protein 2 [Melipona quadrifasciata]
MQSGVTQQPIHALQEMDRFHKVSLDEGSRNVIKNLYSVIKSDIRREKESRHYFEKISADLYFLALHRNSQVTKSRPAERRTGDNDYNIMEDLRLCTVKPVVDCDRRNCFEALSPTKSHILQADSEEVHLAWCSGVHRSLGVHYSKVRLLTSGDEEPEVLKIKAELGNIVGNNVYEALPIPPDIIRATRKCNGNIREFETEKQCKLESDVLMFGCDLPKPTIDNSLESSSDQDSTAGEDEQYTDEKDNENLHLEMLLYKAAAAHNLPVMCAALAAGADKLWTNVNDRGRNALHQAIISGSVMSCEYLILNGARINCQDDDGKTPLYLATKLGIDSLAICRHTAQVCLLPKHRTDQHVEDESGVKSFSIAVKEANAGIVTWQV